MFTVLYGNGELFHGIGDATDKHMSPCVTVLDVGTNKSYIDKPDLSVLFTFMWLISCTVVRCGGIQCTVYVHR